MKKIGNAHIRERRGVKSKKTGVSCFLSSLFSILKTILTSPFIIWTGWNSLHLNKFMQSRLKGVLHKQQNSLGFKKNVIEHTG